MSVYADKVRHEITDEASAAGLTVEEYAANGYNLPEGSAAEAKPAEVVNVTFAPWVEAAISAKREQEARELEQMSRDTMDAARMLTSDELEQAVFTQSPKDKDGAEIGRFFLRLLMERDEKRALDVFRRWIDGGGAA